MLDLPHLHLYEKYLHLKNTECIDQATLYPVHLLYFFTTAVAEDREVVQLNGSNKKFNTVSTYYRTTRCTLHGYILLAECKEIQFVDEGMLQLNGLKPQ